MFAASFGCRSETSTADLLECLNKIDSAELMKLTPTIFAPVIDDYASVPFMPENPLESLKKGEFSMVPMIIGSNKHDGLFLMDMFPNLQGMMRDFWDQWV